jgi:hypothetical protein
VLGDGVVERGKTPSPARGRCGFGYHKRSPKGLRFSHQKTGSYNQPDDKPQYHNHCNNANDVVLCIIGSAPGCIEVAFYFIFYSDLTFLKKQVEK